MLFLWLLAALPAFEYSSKRQFIWLILTWVLSFKFKKALALCWLIGIVIHVPWPTWTDFVTVFSFSAASNYGIDYGCEDQKDNEASTADTNIEVELAILAHDKGFPPTVLSATNLECE